MKWNIIEEGYERFSLGQLWFLDIGNDFTLNYENIWSKV